MGVIIGVLVGIILLGLLVRMILSRDFWVVVGILALVFVVFAILYIAGSFVYSLFASPAG